MLLFRQARGKSDERDGEAVPGVLLSGDHAKIHAWREASGRAQAEEA
jgi:tRNA G37 N-methylase TrmD